MNAQRIWNVFSGEWITQKEASVIVELWAREVLPSSSVQLRDLAETLRISDARAQALLTQVRAESQGASFTYPLWMAIPFYILLTASLVYSTSVVYVLGSALLRNDKVTGAEVALLSLSMIWINAWLRILREKLTPILPAIARRLSSSRI